MGESSNCILNLSESALNSLKTSDLVQKLLFFKFPNFIRNQETYKWAGYHKNVNSRLEEKMINLGKNQVKGEQYCQRNNVELSGIMNSLCDADLENTVINICKEPGIDVDTRDI